MNSAPRIVLVVEDDDDLRHMFRMALNFGGFEVQEAADGYTALRLIDEQVPAAIVLDLPLTRVSGYTVLQEVARSSRTKHVPVIVVTAGPIFTETNDVACFLRKPVTPEKLVTTVHSCIAMAVQSESPL